MNYIRKRIFKKAGMVLYLLCLLSLPELYYPEIVKAGEYDNAYTFYQTYGSEMAFQAGTDNQGEIYYATKAKKDENTGIKYTTIGWQVRVFNSEGALVETLYYQLGGNNMSSIDTRTEEGYEYCLYRVTLTNLKNRLSNAGLNALSNPNCSIIFDACTTTKLNGDVQGGMTDDGPSWGTVYTTYNGIVNAQEWSDATKETLKSYYNKSVEGLFYNVTLSKGNGVSQVLGEGKYCFGTTVTIQANILEGYHFTGWTGSENSSSESYTFVLLDNDVTFVANAMENTYTVVFEGSGGEGDIPSQSIKYNDNLITPTEGFMLEEASLTGWTLDKETNVIQYVKGENIPVSVLVCNLGLQYSDKAIISLYATWDYGPVIRTEDIYVALKDAQNGKITETWLAERVEAWDQEDGIILYGENEKNTFVMLDYQMSDFTEFQNEGSVTETFLAVDSVGNSNKKRIQVYIVDTQLYLEKQILGRLRFISKRFFMDENRNLISEKMGGLDETSIWRLDEEYRGLLERLFMD